MDEMEKGMVPWMARAQRCGDCLDWNPGCEIEVYKAIALSF